MKILKDRPLERENKVFIPAKCCSIMDKDLAPETVKSRYSVAHL